MTATLSKAVTLLVSGSPLPGREADFSEWQSRLQTAALGAPGCTGCELWPQNPDQAECVAVIRFGSIDALRAWRKTDEHRALTAEAAPYVAGGRLTILAGGGAEEYTVQNAATEVIVTDLKPGQEAAYRAWSDRISKVQNAFPGFSGSYTQPPKDGEHTWTTLLRFDTISNLDNWLNSAERAALIAETNDMVDRVMVHRVDTTFPGWFPSDGSGNEPGPWKTSALVLLVLFPIVMLQAKFLSPIWRSFELNTSLSFFLNNTIGLILMAWPVMPLNVKTFSWWLFAPKSDRATFWKGTGILAALYALELFILWHLLG